MHRMIRAFATVALLAASAAATDHHVSPGQSIQAAIDAAVDGDRVLVHAGTYQQVFEFKGKRIEVRSTDGAEATILDGSAHATSIVRCDQGEPLGTVLAGFTLTNGRGRGFPSSYGLDYYGGAVFAAGGTRLVVEDCRIVHNGWNSGGYNNCTFAGGVYCGESQITLVRCLIADNWAWACGGGTLSNGVGAMTTFDRCTVVSNISTNFFGPQGGIGMANDGDVTVRDSIVHGNFGNQIDAFGYPYNQGCVATAAYSCIQGGFTGTGNIAADPGFVSLAGFDVHLLGNSPCIDAGDPAAIDPDGTRRDMGAYPYLHLPVVECAGKLNSAGCMPAIGYAGTPTMSGADDFRVLATNVIGATNGVVLVGTGAISAPYFGGTLCVGGTIHRGPMLFSTGQSGCNGTYDTQLGHAWFANHGLAVGSTLRAQYVYRDQGLQLGNNVGMTDALRFVLGP